MRVNVKVIAAQLGSRMHYAVPRILHSAGVLERFYTDLVAAKGWPLLLRTIAPDGFGVGAVQQMISRLPHALPPSLITHWPKFAIEYAQRQRASRRRGHVTQAYLWAGRRFCQKVLDTDWGDANCIYTFNSAGLELLREARSRGMLTVLEQTIAPAGVESELLTAEQRDFHGWEMPRDADPYLGEFIERERAEWEYADVIVCGSEFVKEAVRKSGGPAHRCRVVPYGVAAHGTASIRKAKDRFLRVLTVGSINLRKGIPYCCEAAEMLRGAVEFRLVGRDFLLPAASRRVASTLEMIGDVPREEVSKHYEWADVFLLPSVCEGSATVCYEALAAGLPVITTPNSGSVVRDGVDGFIVPIRDSHAIATHLKTFVGNRALLSKMSRNAYERASEFTLERYGERLLSVLKDAEINDR